ncbi:MAG: hypothetical protein WC966_05535 [Bradymonadales bacterium]|jgi:energy-coupling factor transporter transmembrane protein EcfT
MHEYNQDSAPRSSLSPTPGLVLGILAVVFAAISLIPCVGSITIWIAVILTIVGLVLAIVAKGTAGIVLNSIAVLVCILAFVVQSVFFDEVSTKFNEGFEKGLNDALQKRLDEEHEKAGETEESVIRFKDAGDE